MLIVTLHLVALNYTCKIRKWTGRGILGCPFCSVALAFFPYLFILSLEGCVSFIWLGRAFIAGCDSFYSQFCSSREFADGVIAEHVAPTSFVTALTGCFLVDLTLKFWLLISKKFVVCWHYFLYVYEAFHSYSLLVTAFALAGYKRDLGCYK